MACPERGQLIWDDFDTVSDKIEADILQNDGELLLEKDCLALSVSSKKDFNYICQLCTKVCITNESLPRHVRANHKNKAADLLDSRQGTRVSCNSKLKITKLKDMYVTDWEKLAKDECYPGGVTHTT